MERRFEYPAQIERDAGGFYLVTFPDLPEAGTDARTREAALAEAADCLEEAIAGRIKRNEEIPIASPAGAGMVLVTLSALYAIKAALYVGMREARLSQRALADKLGKDEKEIHRLLDPAHPSQVSAIEAALRRVGKKVRVTVEDAP